MRPVALDSRMGKASPVTRDTDSVGGLVFEFCVGVADLVGPLRQWQRFGYRVVAEGSLGKRDAHALYGARAELRSLRLQHGSAQHSFVRLMTALSLPLSQDIATWRWAGARWGARLAADLDTLHAIVRWAAHAQLVTRGPYTVPMDDRPARPQLDAGLTPAIVEFDAQGSTEGHVFFVRHGFERTGYGTPATEAEFPVSEITHAGLVTSADPVVVTGWFQQGLGLAAHVNVYHDQERIRANGNAFMFPLRPTDSYHLLDFMPPAVTPEAPPRRPGKFNVYCFPRGYLPPSPPATLLRQGPTLYTLRRPDLESPAERGAALGATDIGVVTRNEFGERALCLRGPEGYWWQLIET